jgi:hypothetical protein
MIIGSIRKRKRKEMLDFFKKIGLNQEALGFIENRIKREKRISLIFFNIYGQDDRVRLRNLVIDNEVKFKKRGNANFFAKRISSIIQGTNDLLLGVHLSDLKASPGFTNWWEYKV